MPNIRQKLLEIKALTYRKNQSPESSNFQPADKTIIDSSDWQESTMKILTKNNFYSTFNFSVLHSKQSEFQNDRNITTASSPQKSMNTLQRGGGSLDRSWPVSKSLVVDEDRSASVLIQRTAEYEASRYRPLHNNPNQSTFITQPSQMIKLKKFENLMNPSEFIEPFSNASIDRKMPSINSFKLIPLKRKMAVNNTSIFQQSIIQGTSTDYAQQSIQTQTSLFNDNFKDSILVTTEVGISKYESLDQNQLSAHLLNKLRCKHQQKLEQANFSGKEKSVLPPSSSCRQNDLELQAYKRQAALKMRKAQRPLSAKQRSIALERMLKKKGMFQDIRIDNLKIKQDNFSEKELIETDRFEQVHTSKAKQALCEEYLDEAIKNKFSKIISKARIPRLGQLIFKNETKSFREQLGRFQFEGMLGDCKNEQDRAIINLAYETFITSINDSSQINPILNKKEDGTDSSCDMKEDQIKSIRQNSKMMNAVIKGISMKMQNYTEKVKRDLENVMYQELVKNLKISQIQADIDQEKNQTQKNFTKEIDNNQIDALEKIYTLQKKYDSTQQDKQNKKIPGYTSLLQGTNTPQLQIATQAQKLPKIERGFIIFPDCLNLEKVNIKELVDDPSVVFDNYLIRRQKNIKAYGDDFWEKIENQKVSNNYTYNSTIYEFKPTAKVAFIKNSNAHSELALPLIAKIKNFELILSDYRLEIGHFEALKASFRLEPNLLSKVTLNNCGLDDQSFNSFIEACQQLNQVTHIHITKGDFGIKGVESLKQLFVKGLQSFKLKDVNLQHATSEYLFQVLAQKSYLKTLSLANFAFSEKSFEQFTLYFQKSKYLEELQISNLSGVRTQNWSKFMQSLANNKILKDLDLSWNNFIENQHLAFEQQRNPYKVFKQVYEKWLKMGTGIRWPTQLVQDALSGSLQLSSKRQTKTPVGNFRTVTIPNFSIENGVQDRVDKINHPDMTQEMVDQKEIIFVEKLMKQSIRQAFAIAFMKQAKKGEKDKDKEKKDPPQAGPKTQVQLGTEPFEQVSSLAMVVTEAIYKFIRRNNVLQHLNLTRCNLSQIMVCRIGLGAKCSSSLMSVHFSNNPGVTAAVKAFLQVKMRAAPPQEQKVKISKTFIEQNSCLSQTLGKQIQTMQAEDSLAHDTVAIREQNKKKADGSYCPVDENAMVDQTLIFTRLLGHKILIPESGRWLIMTNPKHECWICEKYTYSLVFWSPLQISKTQVPSSHMIDKVKIIEKLNTSQEVGEPIIYGSFTNWKPVKMKLVKDFAELHRQPQPSSFFLNLIKKMFNLDSKLEYLDLTPDHRNIVKELEAEWFNTTQDNWRQHIGAYTRFKDTQFINYEHLNPDTFQEFKKEADFDDLKTNPIYVHASLIKPGKNYYIVQQNNYAKNPDESLSQIEDEDRQLEVESKFFLHKAIVMLREEQIPSMRKNLVENQTERVFDHQSSVFAQWKADKLQSLQKCVDNDLDAMNLSKLIKDPAEMDRVIQVISKNIQYLKQCHLDMLATSSVPPFVGELDFVNFYKTCQFADDNLKAASIDLIYVQVNTNVKGRVGLNRGEFIEALIRSSKAKYKEMGLAESIDQALQMLIEEKVKPLWGDSGWHETRVKKFWTNEINDILEVNLEGIMKIFQTFWDLKNVVKKKWMDLKESDYLFTQAMPDLKLTINTARRCFFYSKMSCVDEQSKIEQYNRLLFVEFLECLCRVAHEHFEDTPQYEWPLTKRLEYVLDNLLALKSIERRPVLIESQIDSDADISEDEY